MFKLINRTEDGFWYDSTTTPVRKKLPVDLVKEVRNHILKYDIIPGVTRIGEVDDMFRSFKSQIYGGLLSNQISPMLCYIVQN